MKPASKRLVCPYCGRPLDPEKLDKEAVVCGQCNNTSYYDAKTGKLSLRPPSKTDKPASAPIANKSAHSSKSSESAPDSLSSQDKEPKPLRASSRIARMFILFSILIALAAVIWFSLAPHLAQDAPGEPETLLDEVTRHLKSLAE